MKKIIPFLATVEGIAPIITFIFIALFFNACQPRNAVFCYDNYKQKYTNCPSGYLPGMEFDSRRK